MRSTVGRRGHGDAFAGCHLGIGDECVRGVGVSIDTKQVECNRDPNGDAQASIGSDESRVLPSHRNRARLGESLRGVGRFE